MSEVTVEEDEIIHCGHETEEELKTLHACPYVADVENDPTEICTCCDACSYQHAMDI